MRLTFGHGNIVNRLSFPEPVRLNPERMARPGCLQPGLAYNALHGKQTSNDTKITVQHRLGANSSHILLGRSGSLRVMNSYSQKNTQSLQFSVLAVGRMEPTMRLMHYHC